MRSLIFGEDFTSDPVSKALSLGLRAFSAGQIQVDVAQLSQVGGPSPWPPHVILCTVLAHVPPDTDVRQLSSSSLVSMSAKGSSCAPSWLT